LVRKAEVRKEDPMRLLFGLSKNRARACSSVLCSILFISPVAVGIERRNESIEHSWIVKYEEGTEDFEEGKIVKLTIDNDYITCGDKTRRYVEVPTVRVTQVAYETQYRSVASVATADELERLIEDSDHPARTLLWAGPLYRVLSLFDGQPPLVEGVLSLFDYQRRLIKVTWVTAEGEESFMVFRVREAEESSILEMLESSTGLRSVDLWAEREKAIQDYWTRNPVPRNPLDVAGDKALQKAIQATLEASDVDPSWQSKRLVGKANHATGTVDHTAMGICAVTAPGVLPDGSCPLPPSGIDEARTRLLEPEAK
jgi:hypothetical protein